VAELAEGERRYRFMAEMIPQVVWTATPDGRVDYYNRRWTDYTGLSIESGTRGEWTNVIHPLDEAATLTAWTTAVATGTPYEIEHRIRRADGGWRWMLSRAWPLSDRDGRILRWFGTATDIDDEKRVQQEIAVARDAAERANRAKSRFLAAASHDLRQPLNALGLLVGTLRARLSEPRNLAVVEQIEASVEAMSDLFEGLLDLSKLETGAVELDVRPVSLPALFARLHRELGMEAAAKGLSLRLRSLDVTVRTDATLLERVLRNLLANAIRYTDRGGVMLGVRRRGAQVRVDVIDTGPGIAEEHLEDIFQEFQQLGNPARERGGGHGIGLAIVRRAVDVLGHRLTVRSQPGRGSRFSVDLPLTTEGDAAAASGPTLPGPGSLGTAARAHSAEGRLAEGRDSLPVLLLEDDPLVLMATRMLLEDIGCTVTEARTVDEAEQALIPLQGTGAEPALLLADYRLPGGTNGLDGVLRLRRRVGPRLAAALITGDVTDALEPVARAADVDLLRKPVRPDELHRLIARVRAR
jgi:PAS domain S-box-containing protein